MATGGIVSLFFRRATEERAITDMAWSKVSEPAVPGWDAALGIVPVFAAVRLIAEAVATLPLQQYRKVGSERQPMPLSKVFEPPSGSRLSWVQQPLVSLLMRGNAYGLLSGYDASLGGMRSTATWLHPDKVRNVEGIWYYNGRKVEGDLLHIPGLSAPGSVLGVSPLTMCRQAITAGADAERFMSTWLSNRARPSMVFRNIEKALPSADAAVIKERVSSTVQSGEPFVIGKDWEVTMLGLSADDAGFVQSARLSATQVATVFGIPPQMIGGDAGSSLTYSTVELNQIQFLTNTLRPWITRLEEGFSSLLPRPHYVKFNVDAMLRVDTKTRHEVFQIDRNIGLKSIDELRALEDEQPLPDGQGADYTPLGQMGAARAKEAR